VQSSAVDHRSDIYSFGVTCYHLLAGEPPFRGTGAFDVALKHVQEQPPQLRGVRPDLPSDLCAMIHKMMAKNPNERYQSARDVLRDLAKMRDGLSLGTSRSLSQLATPAPSGALELSLPEQSTAARGRSWGWGLWFFLVLGGVLAAGSGAFAYVGLNPPIAPPQPQVSVARVGPGLPEVRSEKIGATTRERELLGVLKNTEETKPDDAIKASVELGLLYVKERRLKDAEERFDKLQSREREWRDYTARTASVAARLGRAVVLSHTEGQAAQSNKLFADVVAEQTPKGPVGFGPGSGPKGDRFAVTASGTLLRYPDLSAAVADALTRNAVNLNKAKLEPALEQLRYPRRVGRTARSDE
jgi:eukaryotic-like serine/threonine-protein kinase